MAWFAGIASGDLYLSVIVIGELRKGLEMQRLKQPLIASQYEIKFDALVQAYASRILPFDLDAAQLWGHFMATKADRAAEDLQIAAIAASRAMTVVTRNVKHFRDLPVPVFDPFY